MTITLTPEQQSWLEAEVAAGRLPSVEDAVRVAVADFREAAEVGDLSWAKPLCDEAREQIRQGKFLTREEYRARMAKRLEGFED